MAKAKRANGKMAKNCKKMMGDRGGMSTAQGLRAMKRSMPAPKRLMPKAMVAPSRPLKSQPRLPKARTLTRAEMQKRFPKG